MSYKVEIADEANRDLRNIYEYICYDLQSREAAVKIIEQFESVIVSLSEMPKRFRQYEKEPWRSREIRVAPSNSYRIIYHTDDETQVVTVLRIIHQKRNVESSLDKF